MELVNATRKFIDRDSGAVDGATGRGAADPAVREAAEAITLSLSLVAPYVAEEMWEALGHPPSVASAHWPAIDPTLLVTDEVTCVVQVQGKVRARLEVPPDITESDLRSRALADDGVVRALSGREIAKVIVRAPKLVSIVPA
jgi:leucyl-tRNA synthetase